MNYYDYLENLAKANDKPLSGLLMLFVMIASFEVFVRWLIYMEVPPEYIHGIVLLCGFTFGGAILITYVGLLVWLTICYTIYSITGIDFATRRYGLPLYSLYILSWIFLLLAKPIN
jgi:hypothetical protein